MPTPVTPSIPLVKKYMSTVMGEANPSSAEVAAVLQQWQNTTATFKKAMQSMQSMENTKALGPKKTPVKKGVVPSVDFVKEYLKVISGDAKPAADRIKEVVDVWTKNQAAYQEAQVHLAKVKANLNKKEKTEKATTFPTQLKSIAQTTEVGATEPEDPNDIDVKMLLGVCKQELQKKLNPKNKHWGPEYQRVHKSFNQILEKLATVNNKSGFLRGAVKLINPLYNPKAATAAKPGEFHSLATPDVPLSPFAQTLTMTPEKKAQADALKKKIAEYEALLSKLKAEQNKASASLDKAVTDKNKLSGINEKLLKYFSFIEKHCGEYLKSVKETGGKLLFRGQSDTSQPIFVAYPRKDREPKDSSAEAQKLIDKYLSALDFKALRSNSLFTTTNEDQADNYGTIYAIFPKNGFHYTWSHKHDDLVIDSVSMIDDGGGNDAEDVADDYREWFLTIDEVAGWDSDLYYTIEDDPSKFGIKPISDEDKMYAHIGKLKKAIRKMPEHKKLLKIVKEYDHLDSWDDSPEEFHKRFAAMAIAYKEFIAATGFKLVTPNEMKSLDNRLKTAQSNLGTGGKEDASKLKAKAVSAVKGFGFTKENLPAAMKAGHEVMIVGEYIAVNYEEYKKEIDSYFRNPVKKVGKKK
jgi:hypothetical protein